MGTAGNMTEKATSICPLCGGNALHFAEITDYAVSGEDYSLSRCPDCGLIFTEEPPSAESRQAYSKLELELYRADNPRRLLDRMYYHTRFRNIRHKIRIVEGMTRIRRGHLLNYGAHSGYFSSRMEDRGWTVTSLEEHHEKRVFSLEMFHHRMMDLSEAENLPRASFDAITLWHSIEHQEHPGRLIRLMRDLMKDNGLLFIAVPNTDSLDAAYYGRHWAAWDVPRHLWHFNVKSMIELGRQNGLVLLQHMQMPFDAFYISILSEQFGGSRHYILKGMFKGLKFRHASRRNRSKSSSIVYIFRKQWAPLP